MADSAVVGKVAEVVLRVRGEEGPGEVVATVHGIRETFIAYAETPIDEGRQALVIGVRGPRTVDVIAWDG